MHVFLYHFKVIRIHSPMRSQRKEDWSSIPSREEIARAHAAALHLQRNTLAGETQEDSRLGQFGSCKVWADADPTNSNRVSGSTITSSIRKQSNYSKWERMPVESLRKEARDHYVRMDRVSLYKMDGNKLDDLVCVRHPPRSDS